MREIVEQLAEQPGVRLAALVMEDGVPVLVQSNEPAVAEEEDGASNATGAADSDALAALSAGWVLEVCAAIAPLSWDSPQRMALRGAHGTLVLRRAHTAWLLVILAEGLRVEDVLLAMDGTAARLERFVRGLSNTAGVAVDGAQAPAPALPADLPEPQDGVAPTWNAEQELP